MTDFDILTDRRGSYSYKWDVAEGELPMWVADMDLPAPDALRRAVCEVAEGGIYGYSYVPSELFSAVADYYGRRHGARPDTSWMVYSSGAVAAISSMVRRFSSEGDSVLIEAPVYNIFYNSIINNDRRPLSSDLVYSGGAYSMDLADLEEKLSRPETTLMILCNPHNPVGRIWSEEELSCVAELCYKHGVTVISDEVHGDIVKKGCHYTPFYSVSDKAREISITILAASKTFNVAGLQAAVLVAPNEEKRRIAYRGVNTDEVGEPNAFSMKAYLAAYTECDGWVDELCDYLFENRRIACEYINERIEGLSAVAAEATYLLWIDISAVCSDSVEFCRRLRELTGLYLSDGAEYGECGRPFVRMNLGTQRARVLDGLDRLARGVALMVQKNSE